MVLGTATNKLKFSVYIKPTNSFNYLRKSSDHPVHVFKGIPNNLFIRNKKICTDYSDYIAISRLHINRLIKLGHKRTSLIKLCKSFNHSAMIFASLFASMVTLPFDNIKTRI